MQGDEAGLISGREVGFRVGSAYLLKKGSCKGALSKEGQRDMKINVW